MFLPIPFTNKFREFLNGSFLFLVYHFLLSNFTKYIYRHCLFSQLFQVINSPFMTKRCSKIAQKWKHDSQVKHSKACIHDCGVFPSHVCNEMYYLRQTNFQSCFDSWKSFGMLQSVITTVPVSTIFMISKNPLLHVNISGNSLLLFSFFHFQF